MHWHVANIFLLKKLFVFLLFFCVLPMAIMNGDETVVLIDDSGVEDVVRASPVLVSNLGLNSTSSHALVNLSGLGTPLAPSFGFLVAFI